MIKVCNVDEEGRFGGPERRIVQVANALKSYDVETTVLYPKLDSEKFSKYIIKHNIKSNKIDITRLSKDKLILFRYLSRFLYEIFLLRNFFIKNNFHIIHVNGSYQFKVVIAGKLSRTPVIWHLNDTYAPYPIRLAFNLLSKYCCNGFIVAGKKVKKYYLSNKKYENSIIKEIQAPVNTEYFLPRKNILSSLNEEIKIGTVSGINPAKGVENFILIASKILKIYPEIKFFIAGAKLSTQSAYNKMIEDLLKKLKLKNKIKFLGFVDNIPNFLNMLDICIFTSITEASPSSIWEAMAMKKPVITTNVGSVRQFIVNNENGIVVPVGKNEVFVKKLLELIHDKKLRKYLSNNSRKIVLNKLSLDKAAKNHFFIYKKILNTTFTSNY